MIRLRVWLARRQLKAKSSQTRLRAVQKLCATGDDTAIELLVQALAENDREVRCEVASALGEVRDERVVRALMRAVRDPVEAVQAATIQSLKRIGDPAAVDVLAGALMHGTPTVQWRAAQALQSLGWEPKTNAEQIQLFVALGQLGRVAVFGGAAVNALAGVVSSGSYEKRVAAVNALGEINDPAVLKPLQAALRDADALVRTAAAYALAQSDHPQAVPMLVTVLKDRERNVRVAAAMALGKLRDPRAVEPLILILNDKEWEVRAAALESLGRLGDSRAFKPVAARLDDTDQEVRQHALDAVGQVGDESIVEKLVLTLVDEHSGVRQAAARALVKIDPFWERSERVQRLLPTIEAAMKNRESGVQFAASNLLRRITGRGTVESPPATARGGTDTMQRITAKILQDMLRDPDVEVRLAAAESIGRLKASAGVDALKEALDDPNAWVKLAVREALESLSSRAGQMAVPASTDLTSPARGPGAAPADAHRPLVEEVLICSTQSDVLYESQCRDADLWARFVEFVSQKALRLAEGMALGEFNRLKIQTEDARILVIVAPDGGIMVRTKRQPPGGAVAIAGRAHQSGAGMGTDDDTKERVGDWLRRATPVPGVLVRGIRFADQTVVCDLNSRDFPMAALEQAYRSVADTYAVLRARQLLATQMIWHCSRAALHCVRHEDGAILGAFVTAKAGVADLAVIEGFLSEFRGL